MERRRLSGRSDATVRPGPSDASLVPARVPTDDASEVERVSLSPAEAAAVWRVAEREAHRGRSSAVRTRPWHECNMLL